MSWTDDEKRALFHFLTRIVDLLQGMQVDATMLGEAMAEATRVMNSQDREPAPVLKIANEQSEDVLFDCTCTRVLRPDEPTEVTFNPDCPEHGGTK